MVESITKDLKEVTLEEKAAAEEKAEDDLKKQKWLESQKEEGIGGVFDRQARIISWDQKKVES
jgi:hypothetical protein